MTLSTKRENSLLKQDEREVIARTHFPALIDLDDKGLSETLRRVRDWQDKERSLARQMRRSIRGKAETRGGSFPGNVNQPSRRKQVFAGAAKRLNREVARRQAFVAHEALKDAARRALALKPQESSPPPTGQSRVGGMTPIENRRRRWRVSGARIGSVSQAGKQAQAARDSPAG